MTLENVLKYKRDCEKCGATGVNEEHHIIPKIIGGTDKDGRFCLCKKHHDELTQKSSNIIIKWLIENSKFEKEKLIEKIKNHTEWWLRGNPL